MKNTPKTVTLGLLQHACSVDPEANLAATLEAARAAARNGAQIICTQELFTTQYFCQSENHDNFELAEPIPGPTTEAFQMLARKEKVVIIASLFEQRAPGIFHNTAAIIDADGALLGTYRKMHIPDDPLYYEKFYFTPGDASENSFRAWETAFGKIGVLICWDQWYPEAARLTALAGAEIILIPTAPGGPPAAKTPASAAPHKARQNTQRSHANAKSWFVAAGERHWGQAPPPDAPGPPDARGPRGEGTAF
ncbi:MAG: acyltransferase, partial [Verrucomicrobia subdivision 3 bacterium]|nr:acyltransferase [Limisphaerales bacterium]